MWIIGKSLISYIYIDVNGFRETNAKIIYGSMIMHEADWLLAQLEIDVGVRIFCALNSLSTPVRVLVFDIFVYTQCLLNNCDAGKNIGLTTLSILVQEVKSFAYSNLVELLVVCDKDFVAVFSCRVI